MMDAKEIITNNNKNDRQIQIRRTHEQYTKI